MFTLSPFPLASGPVAESPHAMPRWVAAAVAVPLVAGAAYLAALAASVPDVRALARENPGPTAYMRLRAAQAGTPDAPARPRWTPLDSIPPLLACAVVKAEDGAFFGHGGIDWGPARGAAAGLLSGGGGGGASTLSQQLARNLYLGPQRTLHRKLREGFIARRLDRELGKRRILELYLNGAEWGPGVWGAGAAARHHLEKPLSRVEPFETAVLASMLAAPRQPLRGPNLARAHRVQRRVVNQMYGSGLLDEAGWRTAITRVYALREGLKRGWPLERALVEARRVPGLKVPVPPRPLNRPLSPERALNAACGYETEAENERLITRTRP